MTPVPSPRQYTPASRLIGSIDQALRTLLGGNSAAALPRRGDCRDGRPARRTPACRADARESFRVRSRPRRSTRDRPPWPPAHRPKRRCGGGPRGNRSSRLVRDSHRGAGWRTSLLNPVWYAGSFAIGALAGLGGDRTSLGFVAETERQVVEHLEGHLHRLPQTDARTRAIVQQMSVDEERHGHNALNAGGATCRHWRAR